jgi:hypothetical protein
MKLQRKRPGIRSERVRLWRLRAALRSLAVLGIAGMVAALVIGADFTACGSCAVIGLAGTAFI